MTRFLLPVFCALSFACASTPKAEAAPAVPEHCGCGEACTCKYNETHGAEPCTCPAPAAPAAAPEAPPAAPATP